MTGQRIPLDTWSRAPQFALFRGFDRPHYNVTSRIDVSALMAAREASGLSIYRATCWAVATALHGIPELRTRFDDHGPLLFDRITLSTTVDKPDGSLGFTYLDWDPDRAIFDAAAKAEMTAVAAGAPRTPNTGRIDMAYLSCLPWLDYTALDNAMPTADDCIPRISWGKIVPNGAGQDMAMTLLVHHAIADGRHVGAFFNAVQDSINGID